MESFWLKPDPAPLEYWWGSAGSVLRSLGSSGGSALALRARVRVFASKARCGLIPLRLRTFCWRPGRLSQVGEAFGVPQRGAAYPRLSQGVVVTVPPLGVLVARSAGSVLHSQVGLGEDELSRCCARGLGDRLQCSFRPGPAAAGCGCDVGGDGGFESWVGLREIGPVLAGKL